MYSKEEFDKEKTKVLKYILYKKRSEYEIRNKFSKSIEENLLDDIIAVSAKNSAVYEKRMVFLPMV